MIWFWFQEFPKPIKAGTIIAVRDTHVLEDLQAYKRQWIEQNPGLFQSVKDPATRAIIRTSKLLKVTAERIGPDEEGVTWKHEESR